MNVSLSEQPFSGAKKAFAGTEAKWIGAIVPGTAEGDGKHPPQIIVEPAPANLQGQAGELKPAVPPGAGAKQP